MNTPTITLVMIMKNESLILERCLDSVLSIIDYIVITDTGSTDTSVSIVEKYILDHPNLKGKVYHDPWKNFGYNRTRSVLFAQEWLEQEHIDPRNNYILTIDCDMKIKIDPSFKKKDLPMADTYLLQQVNTFVSYYNIRIFRSSLEYKCIGVTHEYWACSSIPNRNEKLDTITIDDVGDGGAKADKFTRDIRLLRDALGEPNEEGVINKDLIEPNKDLHIRYYFYLAQSYNDTRQIDLAIKWYNKRIQAKGWEEEVFISYLRLGELHEAKQEYAFAIAAWNMGYQVLPDRIETLHRIIRQYRIQGHNHIAMKELREAIQKPFPSHHLLFVEHQVYSFRLLEELSVIGFYTNRKSLGFAALEYLQLVRSIPTELKELCVQNTPHYLSQVPLLNNKSELFSMTLPNGDGSIYINSSASLFRSPNGEYYGTVRAVNYSINDQFQYYVRDPAQVVRTKNYWIRTDKNRTIKVIHELRDQHLPKVRTSHIDGLEDMKIAWLTPTKPIGIAVDWERGKCNHPSMVLVHFQKENKRMTYSKIVPIRYGEDTCQKNWGLFTQEEKVYVIYSHHPLLILEIDPETGTSTEYLRKDPILDLSSIRGSSNPIRICNSKQESKQEWLVLVHEVSQQNVRVYYHRFLKYDHNWNLIGISYPFYFMKLFVEFSLSILYENGIISIIYSTRDNTTEMIKMEETKIPYIPFGTPIQPQNLYHLIQQEMKK